MRRTPGSVLPQAADVGEGVHFAHWGNSQAHEGFVVATADVAFAAESGAVAAVVFAAAVVAVAVSFVAAARAVFVAAAAVAVVVHVDVEGSAVAAFDGVAAGVCDAVVAVAGTVFALASVVAVAATGVGVLSVLNSLGWVKLAGCLERSGSSLLGAAWAGQRPTGKAARLSYPLGWTCCAAGCSVPLVSGSAERPGTAVAVPTLDPEL